jgi:hypothetical protein
MTQLIQVISTIVAALIGAWAGARLALLRFERERAFERRLDWYEQTVKALHALGLRAHEAAQRELHHFPEEIRKQAWEEVVKAYDDLAPLLLVSELYGLPHSIRVTEQIAARMSDAAQATDRVEYYLSMSKELRWAAGQIAGECRDHLHLKRLSERDLQTPNKALQPTATAPSVLTDK